jgi:hypothetical protein
MSITCRVCLHPQLNEIERAVLFDGNVSAIARQFGIGRGSVWGHRRHMLSIEGAVELIEARAAVGKTQNSIAAELGLPRQRFNDLLKAKKDWLLAWEKGSSQHEQSLADLLERCITEKLNPVPCLFALKARYGWLEEQYKLERSQPSTPHVMIVLPGAMGADAYLSQVKARKLPALKPLPPEAS